MSTYLESLKSYVGFSPADTEILREFLPFVEQEIPRIVDDFYDLSTLHPEASQVFSGPEQVERLKQSMKRWMLTGLAGPHDEEFYRKRSRIGRVHVQIGLPQRFMFTAMNVIRRDFHHLVAKHCGPEEARRQKIDDALDRLFDIELAIMLQTYHEDSDARLRRHERLATIGQIAASIGHDLRNPLGVMQSSLYLLGKRSPEDNRLQRHVSKIDAQIKLCDEIISNLLELARSSPPRRERVDFAAMMQELIDSAAVPAHIQTELEIDEGVECYVEPSLLRQALVNLLDNASKAYLGRTGRVWVSVNQQLDGVTIEVADEGPGFAPDIMQRVFEPLVTSRSTGTGLGLALVKGIIERHGGSVGARNRAQGTGAIVSLYLPNNIESGEGSQ